MVDLAELESSGQVWLIRGGFSMVKVLGCSFVVVLLLVAVVEAEQEYNDIILEEIIGVDVDLCWCSAQVDVVDGSRADDAWAPLVSISYGVADRIDIRFSGMSVSYDGIASDSVYLGLRTWIPLDGDLLPYLGASVSHYWLDVDAAQRPEEQLGFSGELGVARFLTESVLLRFTARGEFLLDDVDVKDSVTGEDIDVSFDAVSLAIGISLYL